MNRLFDIRAVTNAIYLDTNRMGETSVIVTNLTDDLIHGELRVSQLNLPEDSVEIVDAQRHFDAQEAHQFIVRVRLPAGMEGGRYDFRIDAIDLAAPDETLQPGPLISFAIAQAPSNPIGIGIGLLIVALLLVGVVIGATLALSQNSNSFSTANIAFTAVLQSQDEIFVFDPEARQILNISQNPSLDRSPSWSPDGRQLAFVTDRGGRWQIYIHDMDEPLGSAQLLDEAILDVTEVAWSPDGRHIAYVTQSGGTWRLSYVQADGTNPITILASTIPITSISYLNSQLISYMLSDEFWIRNVRNISVIGTVPIHSLVDGLVQSARWSPRISSLAVTVIGQDSSAIYRVDFVQEIDGRIHPAESPVTVLTRDNEDRSPSWSADGQRILFASTTRRDGYLPQLYFVSAFPSSDEPPVSAIPITDTLGIFLPVLQQERSGSFLIPTVTPIPTATPLPTFEANAAATGTAVR